MSRLSPLSRSVRAASPTEEAFFEMDDPSEEPLFEMDDFSEEPEPERRGSLSSQQSPTAGARHVDIVAALSWTRASVTSSPRPAPRASYVPRQQPTDDEPFMGHLLGTALW